MTVAHNGAFERETSAKDRHDRAICRDCTTSPLKKYQEGVRSKFSANAFAKWRLCLAENWTRPRLVQQDVKLSFQ